jgi:carbon-monoxide dehydrogenase medium subunit
VIPAPFDYLRAGSLAEAIALLQRHGEEAKLLAGGHSLIPLLKLRLVRPSLLVDIGGLTELRYIREEGEEVAIGALSLHSDVARSPLVQAKAPLLAQAAAVIGDVQVRNRGTIGGSLAHADPAADYPAAVLASQAVIVVQGPGGRRAVPASDFFRGPFSTALGPEEVLVEVRVPAARPDAGAAYLKFPHPASGFAVVGCAALLSVQDGRVAEARLAFTGVAGTPFRDHGAEEALRGRAIQGPGLEEVLAGAAQGVDYPLSDVFASGRYRLHLARVLARRALAQALAAAGRR